VAGLQEPWFESWGQPAAEVGDPSVQRVEERPVECHTWIPLSRRSIAVEDDQKGDESSYSVPPPWSPQGWIAHSDSENAQTFADSLETQFQPLTDPSVPAVIEMVDVALRYYFLTPASEHKLTNPDEVQEAIRGLKVGKAPGPNGIPNMALKHLPQRAASFLPISSMQFSSPITSLLCGSTFGWSLSLNRGRIRHCPNPIHPLVSWTRLINYLKRFYSLGSYMK
jgi:hypothetical protein